MITKINIWLKLHPSLDYSIKDSFKKEKSMSLGVMNRGLDPLPPLGQQFPLFGHRTLYMVP